MAVLTTLSQLRSNIASTIRETQQGALIDSFLNLTGLEIHNAHTWTWLRRKQSFPTVASQEDYNLDSEVDRIAFLRQATTPTKLTYMPDHVFYKFVPNPEALSTGTPRIYRLWAETGFSAQLSSDDTIAVVSSSANDGSSFNVRITGRNSSGEVVTETLTLNGTSTVTSSTTWDNGGLYHIVKSGATTGTITVTATTGGATLAELEPDNLAPRYKRVSLYPIPSAVITINYEYYERYRYLTNDTDASQMDQKWNWVLREGALAKAWAYKQNEQAAAMSQAVFDRGLKMMIAQDNENVDYVPVLQPRIWTVSRVRRVSDSVGDNFPAYSLVP